MWKTLHRYENGVGGRADQHDQPKQNPTTVSSRVVRHLRRHRIARATPGESVDVAAAGKRRAKLRARVIDAGLHRFRRNAEDLGDLVL